MQEGTEGVLTLVISDEGEGEWRMSPSGSMNATTCREKMPGKGQGWFAGRFNFVCMRNIDKYQG